MSIMDERYNYRNADASLFHLHTPHFQPEICLDFGKQQYHLQRLRHKAQVLYPNYYSPNLDSSVSKKCVLITWQPPPPIGSPRALALPPRVKNHC